MDTGVQGFHPAVKHFGKACNLANGRNFQAGIQQNLPRAARAGQLHAGASQENRQDPPGRFYL